MCPVRDYRSARRTVTLKGTWPSPSPSAPAGDGDPRSHRPGRRAGGVPGRRLPFVVRRPPAAPGTGGDGHLAAGRRRRSHRRRHGRPGLGAADRRLRHRLRGPGHQPVDDLALPARVAVGRDGGIAAAVVLAPPGRRRSRRPGAAAAGAGPVRGRPSCSGRDRRRGAAPAAGAGRSFCPPGLPGPRRRRAHPDPRAPGHALPPADPLPGPDGPGRPLRPDSRRPGPRPPRPGLARPRPPLHPGGVGGVVGRAGGRRPLGLSGAGLGWLLGLGPGGERRPAALAGRHRLPPRRPGGGPPEPARPVRRRWAGHRRPVDGGAGPGRLCARPARRLPHTVGGNRVRARLRRGPGGRRCPPGRGGRGSCRVRVPARPGPPEHRRRTKCHIRHFLRREGSRCS